MEGFFVRNGCLYTRSCRKLLRRLQTDRKLLAGADFTDRRIAKCGAGLAACIAPVTLKNSSSRGATVLSNIRELWSELRRRKVVRAVVVYWLVAWAVIEVVSVVEPALQLPGWVDRFVIVLAIAGFPIAIVLAWAVDLTPDGGNQKTQPANEDSVKHSGPANKSSIAVLPLKNLSGDAENEYFGDGIATEILNILCKSPELQVASRTSSFSFRGQNVSAKAIALELGVATILEGSVRRASGRVRISMQLIDAISDTHLWSEIYDRELQDIFEVQDEIAGNVAQALRLQLFDDMQVAVSPAAVTNDTVAYDFYLRGTFQFERGNMRAAIDQFAKSTKLDPGFARAWAGLANSYSWICMWEDKGSENIRKADEASYMALELAPNSAEANASRGFALIFQKKYDEAWQALEKSIRLNPRLYEAYYFAGRLMMPQGRMEEAAVFFAKAAEIRPDDVTAPALQTGALIGARDVSSAMKAARVTVAAAERQIRLSPDDSRSWSLGSGALATLGRTEDAVNWAERALSADPDYSSPSTTYNVACTFALCGEDERALDVLEKLSRSATLYRDWIENDADFDNIRENPRFEALLDGIAR